MAEVFIAWELGEGLGHLARLKPLMTFLSRRGHRLTLAARDLGTIHKVLGDLDVTVLQAPLGRKKLSPEEQRTISFGQVLRNVGYHDAGGLATMIGAWKHLFALRPPDLILVDHAPTALLAARSLGCRIAALANGFTHPPAARPFGLFDPDVNDDQRAALVAFDADLTRTINRALTITGDKALRDLADIYARIDDLYLCTVPEFDHYGARENAEYFGPVDYTAATARPHWPPAKAPKVYAYLKFHPRLPELLSGCANAKMNLLLYCNDVPQEVIARFKGSSLRFTNKPLDLGAVAAQAALGIVNANPGTTYHLLRRGLPLVLLPAQAEQQLICARLAPSGAVGVASLAQPQVALGVANAMLNNKQYRLAAAEFATRLGSTDWAAAHAAVYTEIALRLEAA